jgi:tetratricopeptide (TPR) repeat protein
MTNSRISIGASRRSAGPRQAAGDFFQWTLALAFFLFSLAICLAPTLVFASPDAAELVKQGDALDAKLDNARALQMYLAAEKLGETSPDTLYRIARQYALLMNDAPSDDKQRELGEKALSYAKRGVAANPNHAKSVLSVAICYGRLIRFEGARTKVEYSRLVKENAEKALKLDPSDSYAWHVLGAWNYELAQMGAFTRTFVKVVYGGMPAASNEEAARLFSKAVEIAPDRMSHRVELGRTYAALGKRDEARAELRKALSLPDKEKDDAESRKRASETLASL